MANRLFQVFGEVVLRKRGVDEGLRETQREAEKTAQSFRKVGDEGDGSLRRAGDAATRLQSVVSKILIPVALVSAVGAIVDRFRAAAREAEAFRRAIEAVNSEQQKLVDAQAFSQRGPGGDLAAGLKQLQVEQAAAEQAVVGRLEEGVGRIDSLLKQIKTNITGLMTDEPVTIREMNRAATAQMAAIQETFRQRRELLIEEIDLRAKLESEAANTRRLEEANAARDAILEAGRAMREARDTAFGDQIAQAEQNHRDELDRMFERAQKQLELDRKAHEERLRQIEREGQAATRASEQVALSLGVAAGNADALLRSINSKTAKPPMRIRTMRGGG